MIVIGVDVHKHSLTAVAVDEAGRMLDEPLEGGSSGVERGGPGLDVGDVLEPARNRLEQLGLLA